MSFDLLAPDRFVAARGGWSHEVVRRDSPIDVWVGLLASVAVVIFAVRFTVAGIRRVAALQAAHRLATALPGGGELAMLVSSELQAFAVPGRPGRIAVTTGMLGRLDGGQRCSRTSART